MRGNLRAAATTLVEQFSAIALLRIEVKFHVYDLLRSKEVGGITVEDLFLNLSAVTGGETPTVFNLLLDSELFFANTALVGNADDSLLARYIAKSDHKFIIYRAVPSNKPWTFEGLELRTYGATNDYASVWAEEELRHRR